MAGRTIVIFGGSAYGEETAVFKESERLGAALAGAGWVVATGGYGGTMLAASRGAASAGGHVIGIGCTIFKSDLNAFVAEARMTDSIYDRLRGLMEIGDAYIVMPGSTGTLAELGLVWELINKHQIPTRPILCWGDFWFGVVATFAGDAMQDSRVNTLAITERRGQLIEFVSTPAQAVATLRHAFDGGE